MATSELRKLPSPNAHQLRSNNLDIGDDRTGNALDDNLSLEGNGDLLTSRAVAPPINLKALIRSELLRYSRPILFLWYVSCSPNCAGYLGGSAQICRD
ncbi:hypothetical protein TNCV_2965701 [Trichonephila clavipes]|nr:hypothetical protein TNCV_2965701 [Trichonephila clavipes]